MPFGGNRHRLSGSRPVLRYAPRSRPTPTPTRPSSFPPPPPSSSSSSASSSQATTSHTRQQTSARRNPSGRTTTPTIPRHRSTGHVSSELAPPWPWNPEETALIQSGYKPAYPTPKPDNTNSTNDAISASNSNLKSNPPTTRKKMAEPRARAARHKGQMNFAGDLRLLLLAYGDPRPHPSYPSDPLPETIRVLDEIVTDFVLEMCHGAAQYASYSRRQKIKVDDFRFALRRDPNKLGRVQELLRMERELKEARKAFDQNDDQVGNLKDAAAAAAAAKKGGAGGGAAMDNDELGPAESVDGRKSKGKGKRSAAARRDSDVTEESSVTVGTAKKRKVGGN
ncbi:putative transcription initiation factor TFIID subunit 13 [Aspergillus homomorphus CBS 101889]|uniref:Transcription initiation factor TFIID subunit 13 n=1 Tax=Aspergillus homomorphus (strain CBS 101889) TaxID=1450537 RepID=A0A395HSX3_ASPHC|nr:TFIID-18kDa-domain-containing protein [Aspergillus homomorphus CBS 101889]RAL09324.1 TFIID-18kDa-domain-containing protein [Aspergillus homomorphus CBS 101889]